MGMQARFDPHLAGRDVRPVSTMYEHVMKRD
jgi:hypothetical protein